MLGASLDGPMVVNDDVGVDANLGGARVGRDGMEDTYILGDRGVDGVGSARVSGPRRQDAVGQIKWIPRKSKR